MPSECGACQCMHAHARRRLAAFSLPCDRSHCSTGDGMHVRYPLVMRLMLHREKKPTPLFDSAGQRVLGAAGDGRPFQEMHLIVHFMPAATRKYCAVPSPPPMVWEKHDKRVARFMLAREKQRQVHARQRDRAAAPQHMAPAAVTREQVVRDGKRTASRIPLSMYCV